MSEVRYKQIATTTWNINKSYDVGTVVEYDGNAYVSVKAVPVDVNIGFTDYWKKITVENDIESLQNNVEALQSDVEGLTDSIVVDRITYNNISFTNNTTIELSCTKEGYTPIGVVGWQLPSIDRTKVTGLIELYINPTSGKLCANPCCTESVTNGYLLVWVLYAKA